MDNKMEKQKTYLGLVITYIFNLFPIKKNKIFIFSYYGSQYGCSPKYISEYIVNNYPKDKFDIVWAFNDLESKEHLKGIRKVRIMTLKYFYELCTSKVIITNFRTTDMFVKRKQQYYIQTWHSSLRLKQIEKDAERSLPLSYVEMAKKDSKKCDLLLSGCKYSTGIFKRAFWYDREIFEYGTPRNDMLFMKNGEKDEKIKSTLGLSKNTNIILYAPTFRKNDDLGVYELDYSEITKSLHTKFGGEWVFLVKLHPHLMEKSSQLVYGKNVIDVTKYDDIQELLSISDVLISDYSSLIFDYSLTKRPCFLYVSDLDEYISNDRKLYFDISQLPFISAKSSEELIDRISNYDEKEYKKDLEQFFDSIGSFEEGNSCEMLSKRISEICFN